ncbi:MAG: CoA transferase [Chloroflexi bacterium]|nr:CoA transferase [Chloroflexota bacterium]
MPPMPLEGITVLDCTQVMAGPFCTMLLADMGADVVKVEKPGGDDSRRMGPPFINGESAAFLGINRNKRSIVLDLRNEVDRSVFRRIAQQADVVAENFRPGTMERLGLGPVKLREAHPELIWVSISGFGQTGPYASRPGYDLLAQGMSGMMSVTGYPDSPPVKVSIPLADLSAGLFAANGVLAAYVHRLKTGEGQVIDTSLLEAAIALTVWEAAEYWGSGAVPGPKGSAHRLVAPYQAMQSADGYFNIGVANQANYERLCAALDRPDLLADSRFTANPDRVRNYEALAEEIQRTTRERTSGEWLAIFEQAGVPAGPIYGMDEVFANEHVMARRMVAPLEHPVAGVVNNLGIPVKMSATPGQVRMPAPTLGQHTESVLRQFEVPEEEAGAILSRS